MGIKYLRKYSDIEEELTLGIMEIDKFYDIFEISTEEWQSLSEIEKKECAKTLADDIFYGLGEETHHNLGAASINYIQRDNLIKILYENLDIKVISLI